jgi:hypothetical protein
LTDINLLINEFMEAPWSELPLLVRPANDSADTGDDDDDAGEDDDPPHSDEPVDFESTDDATEPIEAAALLLLLERRLLGIDRGELASLVLTGSCPAFSPAK